MVIIAASEAVAQALVQKLPFIPQIQDSGPMLFLGHPNVEGGTVPHRCAWAYHFTEQQIDFLVAIVRAEGVEDKFSTADSLPGDWRPRTP